MDLLEFIPFKTEFAKAYHGFNGNATHTSETPVFNELKVRRFDSPATEISAFIVDKVERWVGWDLKSEKTAVGGMTTVRATVSSFILFGLKIDVSFGLLEETDIHGHLITTLNAKAETKIDSKGDLGESRRVIRMMLNAVDHAFSKLAISEEDYQYRSNDAKGAAAAFQKIFNEANLQQQSKPEGSPKAKTIEFKKTPTKQTILLKPIVKSAESTLPPSPVSDHEEVQGSTENGHAAVMTREEAKPSRPKITIITTKKTI